jgi:hypothetical protein
MIIEVKPYELLKWGVSIDGVVFGVSKSSIDCDFAAWQLQRMFEDEQPEVLNYPEDRTRLIAEMEERRNAAGGEKKSGRPKPGGLTPGT